MSKIDQKLKDLSIVLEDAARPIASYLSVCKVGNLVFVSGQLPRKNGEIIKGLAGLDVSKEDAKEAAGLCVLSTLSVLKSEFGNLDLIKKCVKLGVFINCDKDFTEQSYVANGASDLLVSVFGENGKHARSAVGVSSLPLGACVEIESVFEI